MTKRVLVVEDYEDTRNFMRFLLEGYGYKVDEATDGQEAVDSVKNHFPDLILMDIELADGQSFEIFNLTDVKCPVIFTTSYDEYALQAFKVNSIDYLLKPVQKEDLEIALNKFRQMKTLYKKAANGSEVNIDHLIKELQQKLQPKEYRKRFLVKHA